MLNVLLIDDEQPALDLLTIALSGFEQVHIVGQHTDPFQATEALHSADIDAVFLDVQMPGLSGMEAARKMKDIHPNLAIIFVTAYMEFAVEAFELESTDYLLKPVTKSRLQQAVNRLLKTKAQQKTLSPSLSISCFGQFQVINRTDKQPLTWKTNKVKELCAYLVHHAGKAIERDHIIEALWPEVTADKAKTSLYTSVSYLRSAFKQAGFDHIIMKQDKAYSIDLTKIECDFIQWSKLVIGLDTIHAGNEEQFERAVHMCAEGYMSNIAGSWAEPTREEVCKQKLVLYQQLAEYNYQQRNLEQAISYTEQQAQVAPYSDEICQRLILLHLEMGSRAEALLVYQRFEARLRQELNLTPSLPIRKLIQKVRLAY